jgi:hypothetical protein
MKRFGGAAFALALSTTGTSAIVGGVEDSSSLASASVMVLSSKGGVCSGVVVAQDAILTAAHCVTGAAEHRVHFRDGAGQPILVVPVGKAVHPDYVAKAIESRRRSIDLALIRMPEPLPARFAAAILSEGKPSKDAGLVVGGYGVAREGDARSSGTFRAAALRAVEPHGPSRILIWARSADAAGACQGDSGGPMAMGSSVFAITSWSTGAEDGGSGRACGGLTQGILLGPQRAWIDATLSTWSRAARWN